MGTFLKNKHILLFSLIIIFALATNYFWTKESDSINGVDSQNHLFFSINFYYNFLDIVSDNELSIISKTIYIKKMLGNPWAAAHPCAYWPNGLNLTSSFFYLIFGKSLASAKLSLLPFLFILLFSTYMIGRLLFSNSVGITASFLVFMYPMIFESSRQYQLDFPLTAMVALSILLLIKCNYFNSRKYAALSGLSLGWAMLIKGQAILFIIWPLSFVIYKAFRNSWRDMLNRRFYTSKQLQNLTMFAILSFAIASIWWLPNMQDAIDSLQVHIYSADKALESYWDISEKYSADSISFHFRNLFSSLSPFLFVIFLVCFIFFLFKKAKDRWVLLNYTIFPFLIFSLVFTVKHPRFLMPIFPATAIITAWRMSIIKNRILRNFILFFIVIFCCLQFYVLSYSNFLYRDIYIGPIDIFGRTNYESPPPNEKKDLKPDQVVKIIRKYIPYQHSANIGSIVLTEDGPGVFAIPYYLKIQDRFLNPIDLVEMHMKFLQYFESLDFLLICIPSRSSLQWPSGTEFESMLNILYAEKIKTLPHDGPSGWNRLLRVISEARPNFYIIEKIPLDSERVYLLYKRKTGLHE